MILKISAPVWVPGKGSKNPGNWIYITDFNKFEVDKAYVIAPKLVDSGEEDGEKVLSTSDLEFYLQIYRPPRVKFKDKASEERAERVPVPNRSSLHPVDRWAFDPKIILSQIPEVSELDLEHEHEDLQWSGKILTVYRGDKTESIGMMIGDRAFLLNDEGKTVETI